MRHEKQLDSQEIIREALSHLRDGRLYADVRVTEHQVESMDAGDGESGGIEIEEDSGFGVRVLADGAWGFAASPERTKSEVRRVAKLALQIARASAMMKKFPVRLARTPAVRADYKTQVATDPFAVPLAERMDLLIRATGKAKSIMGVASAGAAMSFSRHLCYFGSTEGASIRQEIMTASGSLTVSAGKRHGAQVRSYPTSQGGDSGTGGYERILALKLEDKAEETAEAAVALNDAQECPSGEFTIILGGDQLNMQLHETVGHPLELDRIFGAEANFSGTSFASVDQMQKLRYASDMVNIVTDPTIPGGLGSYGFDDDGTPAQRADLIRSGMLAGFLSGRETAGRAGFESSANNRASGWRHFPINRMSNTILIPGEWSYDDLISDTDDGLLIMTTKGWSIDDRRENFRFDCEIAYEIKGGKIGRMFKNPSYSGRTTAFWRNCDAVCNDAMFRIYGTPTCGKGEPSQTIFTAQGAAPARFRNVKIKQ